MEEPEPSHSNDLERLLQSRYADTYFLRATEQGFQDILEGRGRRQTAQTSSKKLSEISNQALTNGEIDLAEKYAGKAIRKEKYEDASRERNPEPYYYLAEVLKKKASEETLQLPQRQRFLLQAASLYNFVKNCFNKSTVESEFSTTHENVIPGKISKVQESLIVAVEGDPLRCRFNFESKGIALAQLREESKRKLEIINDKYDTETGDEEDLRKIFIKQAADIRDLYKTIASKMKQFFAEIIQESIEVLGEPPCEYEVILLGSLAREEMTPYSDLEWAILTSSDDEQSKIFFRNLTNLVHFQIINLGETILPFMDIEVLKGEWFYDDVTPKGLSFDGLLDQASKTPLGNTRDFELIHSPTAMANFQSNFWYTEDPRLGEILLTFAPLNENRHALLDEYNKELEKVLREPCDLESCDHDARPTRGSCRGLSTLKDDIGRYEPRDLYIVGILSNFDGKLFDIKKEIYRLTDRVVVALSNVFEVGGKGSFEALDKLCERNVISPSAKDNVASAVAIALKMRLSTYLSAGKQQEAIKGMTGSATSASNLPGEKELFHFFYVSVPLYESLRGLCNDVKNRSEDLAKRMFFSCSDAMKGHIHSRLLNYDAASECYKSALEDDPENIAIKMRLEMNFLELVFRQNRYDDLVDVSTLDFLRSKRDDFTKILYLAWFSKLPEEFTDQLKELQKGVKALIKDGEISVMAVFGLNLLGASLIVERKAGKAYQCLHRALIMEQTIFGDNPSLHVVLTLALLGSVCHDLGKIEEGNFCLERSLRLLPSSGDNFKLARKQIYKRLAISYSIKGNLEQAIFYSERGLFLGVVSVADGRINDSEFLCLMAVIWSHAGEEEMALECARNANESLRNVEGNKVETTCFLAFTYDILGETDEAKLLLHRGLEETQDESKIGYLQYLGDLCRNQGLVEEAEQHYKAVLNQLIATAKDINGIISTLLVIADIVIENKKFPEAVSYLEEAAKYLSDLNDNNQKFRFLQVIAKRWEDLKDYNQAYMYLNKALKVCESVLIWKVEPRHEIDLRIKLGDLVEEISSLSGAWEGFLYKELVKIEQRKHYDQAYDLLQRYLPTGKLDCCSVDLLTSLAEKYTSIDLAKSDELLLKAAKINEETLENSGSRNINEQSASIFFTRGIVELKKENHAKALEFFHRSLRMELEIHASDPFDCHISEKIFEFLRHFVFSDCDPFWEELETMKQQLLKLWEQHNQKETPSLMITEKAYSLRNMAFVCVCLKDYEKAEELNLIATDILTKSKEKMDPRIKKINGPVFHVTDMTLDYVKRRQIQNKPVTRKRLLNFITIIFKLNPSDVTPTFRKELVSCYCKAEDSCTFSSNATKKVPQEQIRDSEELSPDAIARIFRDCSRFIDETSKVTGERTDQPSKEKAQQTKFESEYHNACLLAESILENSNHRYLRMKEKSFLSAVMPLSETSTSVNSFIKEAENARDKKNMYQMIVFLELASSQTSVLENEAKISKLVGECQLYLQSYRMAAVSFKKSADIYRSEGSVSDLEYMKSLIGLARSHMLCNDMKNALCACEEGLEIQSQLTTSSLFVEKMELLYLAARCAIQLNRSPLETFEQYLERRKNAERVVNLITPDFEAEVVLEYAEFTLEMVLLCESFFPSRAQSEEKRMEKQQNTKETIQTVTNEFQKSQECDIRIQRRFYSCVGQILVIIGETNDAMIPLTKSLADFFVPGTTGTILPLDDIIPLLDAITATNAAASPEQQSQSPFQQTLELCRDEYLKLNDNPFPLLNFFRNLGNYYVDSERTKEAIFAYEAGLAVVEHLILDPTDQINARGEMLLHLANAHRIQALENTGRGDVEERRLAEKYYKYENGDGTEKCTIHKNIMYANFLCDEGRFEEAIVVLNQAIEAGDKLWYTTVVCSYSQRVLYGSDIKKYIESHGDHELLTRLGFLAYASLVRTYVQLGNKREACKALERLSTNGHDLPPSSIYTTSCRSQFISTCQKYLLSLIEEPKNLCFDDSEFPLSPGNLAKLYYELGEYELTLKLCQDEKLTTSPPTNETECLNTLSILRLTANALVMLGKGDESLLLYSYFLQMLDEYQQISNKSFDEQQAIISQFSIPESIYLYRSLGRLMLKHEGKIDDTIACYEHCVGLGPANDNDQNWLATLADLYQTKALTNGKDDETIYRKWMDKAQDCFQKLLIKNIEMTPFVETTFASFLLRTEQFAEAIFHFKQLLAGETDTVIRHNQVDIPLSGVHMAREIEARGEVCLPLKVDVYYQVVLAYFKCGRVQKAQESALLMEEYVENISPKPEYLISRSILAYTYKETGNEVKAIEILKTVLETEADNEPVKLALEECTTIEERTSSCN